MEEKPNSRFIESLLVLYFLLLPFLFFNGILDPFLLARHFFTNVLLVVILFFVAFRKIQFSFIFTPTAYFLLGFVLTGLISFSNPAINSNSHYIFSKNITFFTYLVLITSLLYKEIVNLQKLKTYLILFGLVSLTITLFSLLNKTINGQHLFRQVNLISGTFANKNLLSSLLFCTLPFYFLGMSLSKKMKIISVSAIILTVVILIILRTRTALIATAVFLMLVLYYELKLSKINQRNLKLLVLSTLILITAGSFWFFMEKGNFHSSSDINIQYFYRLFDTKTLNSRTLFWNNSITMIGDNFWTGTGLGNWIIEFPKYGLNSFTDYGIVNGNTIVTNPHNDFLLVFCETGFIGIVCYLGVFATVIYQSISLIKTSESAADKKMFFCLLSFIVGYLIIAFFDFPLDRIEHQILLLTIFSIVNAYYLKSKNRPRLKSKLLFLLFGIGIVYSTTVVLYRINSEKHIFKMLESRKQTNWDAVITENDLAENYFCKTDIRSIPLEWYKAAALFKQNRMEKSNESFSKAHAVNPYNITVLNDWASSFTTLNQPQKAIALYTEALKISPNYENARLNLAAVYFNKKEYENAFATIEKCSIISANENYKVFLVPIVEKKLNAILENLNDPKLNSYLQHLIKNEDDLINLYFDAKKKNRAFEEYLKDLSNSVN